MRNNGPIIRHVSFRLAAFTILAVAAVFTVAAIRAAGPQQAVRPRPPIRNVAQDLVVPFRAGETLNYSGQWLGMSDVVSARLAVLTDSSFDGRPAWHFQAQLHTKNPLRYIFAVDDQFDSHSASLDLSGMQFESDLHESSKQSTQIVRLSPVAAPSGGGVSVVQVPPGTRDAVGFLYYLRAVDWQKTPEVHGFVFDGRKIYDVRANVATAASSVTVQAGKFTATGISLRIFDHSTELTGIKLMLWLAQDAAHTPVLIEAELPFGTGRVDLTPGT